jgi:hypothetical protein
MIDQEEKELSEKPCNFFASLGGYQEIPCHFPQSNANVNAQQIKIRAYGTTTFYRPIKVLLSSIFFLHPYHIQYS